MPPHFLQILALSLDSLAAGVLAARLLPHFAALPYALAFGLADGFAACLGRCLGPGPGLVLLLAAALGAVAACRRLNPAAGWRTATGTALPLLFGIDSLVCPVATADLPVLIVVSAGLGFAGLRIGQAGGRWLPRSGQAMLLALACLMLFI